MSGFVLIHRDLFGNPQFRGKDDEYAALWLISKAAWEATSVRPVRDRIPLERGQCAYAISYLAQAWECSKATAHARLRHFEKIGFIRTQVRTDCTVITLCKYSEYQASPNAPRTLDQTEPERSPNAPRTNNKEGNERKEDTTAADAGANAVSPEGAAPLSPRIEVASRVLSLIGLTVNDPKWFGDTAQVQAWLNSGADPECDIYPTIERVVARRRQTDPNWMPRSLTYFADAVAESMTRRTQPMPTSEDFPHENRSRQPGTKRGAYDPNESRRRTLEAHVGAVGRVHGNGGTSA
jgi:hypothetical protein